jgi:23S rRNA (adenine2503-C2)-methyltransferase
VNADEKISIFGLTPKEMETAFSLWNWPPYRALQIIDWIYNKLAPDSEAMSNLSKADRARLNEEFNFSAASITSHQVSDDGTQKLLLTWPDGGSAETVMIPEGRRRTACVSSQVGCPVGCKFCASGINGLQRNLSAAEIVEQIFMLNRVLAKDNERINHIVFMGMGEPLANYANVIKAIRILHDPACFNIGARKITVSTVGLPSRIRQLAEEDLQLNLAISLHAPNEPLRESLIPWAEHFGLADILDAARYYFHRTGREVTLEYILLAGVNDQPKDARQLAELCKGLRVNVNLIRYNPVPELDFERPAADACMNFQSILRHEGVNAHMRKSRGRDIDAACGQLRRKNLPVSEVL